MPILVCLPAPPPLLGRICCSFRWFAQRPGHVPAVIFLWSKGDLPTRLEAH